MDEMIKRVPETRDKRQMTATSFFYIWTNGINGLETGGYQIRGKINDIRKRNHHILTDN